MSEKNDYIKPVQLSSSKSYMNEIYEDFWMELHSEIDSYSVKLSNCSILLHTFDRFRQKIREAKKYVIILTDRLDSEYLIDDLLEASENGARIYILIEEPTEIPNEKKKNFIHNIKKLINKALIRIIPRTQVHFLLIDPDDKDNSFGFITNSRLLFNSDLFDLGKFLLQLSRTQTIEVFDLFKLIFWTYSEFQIIHEEDIEFPKKIEPLYNRKSNLKWKYLFYKLNKDEDFISQNLAENIQKANREIEGIFEHFDLDNQIIDAFNSKIDSIDIHFNTTFYGWRPNHFSQSSRLNVITPIKNDLSIPILNGICIDKKVGILFISDIPMDEREDYFLQIALKLTAPQMKQFQEFLSYIKKISNYRYFYQEKLENINHNIIKIDDNGEILPFELDDNYKKHIDDINCKIIDEFLKKKELKERDFSKYQERYKKKIDFEWRVIPPRLPDKSEKDDLYRQWDQFYQSYETYITDLKGLIQYLINYYNNNKLILIQQIITGYRQKIEEFSDELKEFSEIDIDQIEIEKLREKINRLHEIHQKLVDQYRDILTKSDNCKRIDELKEKIEIIKHDYTEIENKLKKYIEKIKKEKENLNKNQNSLNSLKEAAKKLTKKKKKDLYNDIDIQKGIIKKIKNEIEDLEKERNKLEKRKMHFENSIKNNQKEIERIKRTIENEGFKDKKEITTHSFDEFMRKGRKQNKKIKKEIEMNLPAIHNNVTVPSEKIPEVGILYRSKKERFIVIQKYSEIAKAKEIEKKYKCKIVVNGGGK
ncbi:MAG: hypothetical protein K9W44_14910 [Candidatus Lokiarchaeota archaeon]|nr:hypothetical protein [Candidatus Harpocratesius repetitus]